MAAYDRCKSELREGLAECRDLYKKAIRFLTRYRGKPGQYVEAEQERVEREEHCRQQFRERVRRLVEDALSDAGEGGYDEAEGEKP